jgi:hypothetical protein
VTWRLEFVWSVADPPARGVRNEHVHIRRAPLEPMPDDMLLAGLATGDANLALASCAAGARRSPWIAARSRLPG